jgi:hypothetical protein
VTGGAAADAPGGSVATVAGVVPPPLQAASRTQATEKTAAGRRIANLEMRKRS